MPSNGFTYICGISISNVHYKRLDLLYYMCSTGGRVCVCRVWWASVLWWWLWGCYIPTIHPMQWGTLYIGLQMGPYIGVKCAPFSLGAPISDVLASFWGSVMGLNRANNGCLCVSFNLFSIILPSDSAA